MVRVLKCHSFSSQQVIPVKKEPLTICAADDKVFIATSDCEILIYQVRDGNFKEIHRCPTISEVDKIVYNSFKNYIATIELKKSWKREMKSAHIYLNWQLNTKEKGKPRTKVSVAGKSHVQHVTSSSSSPVMEIVEVPVEKNASCIAVCKYTGNFAIACSSEVKLCTVVEKTVANSNSTYIDVEVFLELCWNFQITSLSLCEEFIVCCSHKEIQGIRVRYDEGEKINPRSQKKFVTSPTTSISSEGRSVSTYMDNELLSPNTQTTNLDQDSSRLSSGAATPQSVVSETFMFQDQRSLGRVTFSPQSDSEDTESKEFKPQKRLNLDAKMGKDLSSVGMWQGGWQSPKPTTFQQLEASETKIVNDENFVEWNFQPGGGAAGSSAVCLPGLHTPVTQAQCHHHAKTISPPVLSDFSVGNKKSSSGVQAETVLYLSDTREQEDWMSVTLIPTYSGGLSTPLRVPSVNTDRMRSLLSPTRTSMCCYVSGNRGGYLYQLSPALNQISLYKYTDQASQVGVSESHLHVATATGIETYTSRWGVLSQEMLKKGHYDEDSHEKCYPPSSLDICLCGHEPFFGVANLSVGKNFLALLSKVQDPAGKEAHWSVYILHVFNLIELYKEMISFAEGIHSTGPSSYIHLLLEAHLLVSTHPLCTVMQDPGVKECLQQVSRLIGDYYSKPGQDEWHLCCSYYRSSGVAVNEIVADIMEQTEKHNRREFGKGILDYLNNVLFLQDEYIDLSSSSCDNILKMYAVSAPEKLSKVILLSNMKAFTPETAFHHLKTWLSVKSSSAQQITPVDKLAMVQLHLTMCEVEMARTELNSIQKSNLVDVCSSHPTLIHENFNSFTPLAQLLRQHMSGTLLDILVEMLDRCVMSLDSLLYLLKSQSESDDPYSNHVREVLELILTDHKRVFLFEEAVTLLCEIYIKKLKDKSQPTTKQNATTSFQKFSLPQGNGHFAPRFGWLDFLPPFQGPQKMVRPCIRLEFKPMPGQGLRTASIPISAVTKQGLSEKCNCCSCSESLLKLQSLLCSTRTTNELASLVLQLLGSSQIECEDFSAPPGDDFSDSIKLLCLIKLDLDKATEQIVDKYPNIVGSFASCCFNDSVEKYTYLLRYMEAVMKKFLETPDADTEEIYVKAYKDLLTRLTELFHPAQFMELLPADGSLYFLIPFLSSSLETEHTEQLKRKIVHMGKELMSQV